MMAIGRVPACTVLAFAAIAGPLAAQRGAAWVVGRTPITAIGSADDAPGAELASVSGARRLSDGRVVVANGKPLELRVYDPHGALLMRIGRKGGGPGEFGGRLDLLNAGGDSILVYDQGNERLLLFRADGKLAREWPPVKGGSPRGGVVLYRQSFARAPIPAATGCLKQVLAALPPVTPPALREVVADHAGRYLVHTDTSTMWTVYNRAAAELGALRLPARFDVYEAGVDWILGKALLEDDVEQVQVLRVTPPAGRRTEAACAVPPDSFPEARSPRADELKQGLRAAMTAGEMAYSDYAAYPSTLDSLRGLREKLPANTVFRVLHASNRGWGAALFDKRSTLVCVFAEADAVLAGWSDGGIRCSD